MNALPEDNTKTAASASYCCDGTCAHSREATRASNASMRSFTRDSDCEIAVNKRASMPLTLPSISCCNCRRRDDPGGSPVPGPAHPDALPSDSNGDATGGFVGRSGPKSLMNQRFASALDLERKDNNFTRSVAMGPDARRGRASLHSDASAHRTSYTKQSDGTGFSDRSRKRNSHTHPAGTSVDLCAIACDHVHFYYACRGQYFDMGRCDGRRDGNCATQDGGSTESARLA